MCLEKLRIERKKLRMKNFFDARKVNFSVFCSGMIAVD